jgi:AcrR family transcriptional regulator
MTAATEKTRARPYGGVSADQRLADRRERLLDAALELYGTRGYAVTGVKDVCRRAGLTDRYFYESFPNSGELFAAAFDRTTNDLLVLVAQRLVNLPADPSAQVRAAIEAFVRALADDPRKARLLFVEVASAGAEVERHVRATVRRFAALVIETARPHLPADVSDQLLRMAALSLIGAIALVMVEWQDGQLDASIDELIDYFVDVFLAAQRAV